MPTSKGRRGGARPVCLLVLTILATGLGWEVDRGRGMGGGREGKGRGEGGGKRGGLEAILCEILNTPLTRIIRLLPHRVVNFW